MEYGNYEKTFVMLTGQSGEFGQRSDVAAKGHIKIETGSGKGAMRIGVQNLRFFEKKEYIYKLILFGKRKERTIHSVIGTVTVNRYGSGETYFRFDPRDVDGKGSSIGDYYYAIVAAVSLRNEKEPLHPVLKGTLDLPRRREEGEEREDEGNPSDWERRDGPSVKAASIKLEGEETGEPEAAAETEAGGGGEAADTEEELLQIKEETAKADGVADEEEGAGKARGGEVQKNDRAEETAWGQQPERMQFNDYYNRYLLDWCRRMEGKAEFQDDTAPFHYDETNAAWKKIVNVSNFPLVSPMGRYFSTKYRHYIFGITQDRYYFGVPGRFLREEQPESGESGFVFWQPITGAEKLRATEAECSDENRRAAYGYWIVAVDRRTGDIEEV